MADGAGGWTRGSRDLDFMTTNPAMDAFQAGQKIAREEETHDADIEAKIRTNVENAASAPSRLRTINATADTARANADVAQGTVASKISKEASEASTAGSSAAVARGTIGSRIAQSGAAARTAVAGANVAEGSAPYQIENARNLARTNNANADVSEQTVPYKVNDAYNHSRVNTANADVTEQTAPDKVESSKIGLRQQNANAVNTEMTQFHKTIEYLAAGNIDAAQQLAAATGQKIPDEVVNNADVRDAVVKAAQYAKEHYPNKFRDQQMFMQGFLKDMADRRNAGGRANDPQAPYNVTDAPEPPIDGGNQHNYEIFNRQETDENGKPVVKSYKMDKRSGTLSPIEGEGGITRANGGAAGGGAGGGRQSVFQQKQNAWLAVHPGDDQGALEYASGRRALSEPELVKSAFSMANRELQGDRMMAYKPANERTAWVNKRAQEIAQSLRGTGGATAGPPAAAPAPGSAPAPAPSRTPQAGLPPGDGTQRSPFQATTQAHVDWFKTNAPPGSIIIVDGKPYTK